MHLLKFTPLKRARFAVLIVLASAAAWAQTPPQPISIKPLKGNVYWVTGGVGSNTGFVVGDNGVISIDSKMTAESAKELLAALAKITPKPVTDVILTHSDSDHVNGLAGFPTGLTIIAQENCKKEMEASASSPRPAPPGYLPTKTVDKKESTKIDGVHLTLLHWAPAHTSGDLVVYLPDQKVVFTGDIVATQRPLPLIHLEKNGTSAGWIETMKGLVALDADTFVPGHGDLQTKADLRKRLADAEERRAKVQELVAGGKSLEEVKKAVGESDAPAAPGAPQFASFTEVVYKEFSKNERHD
jgi:cyclase